MENTQQLPNQNLTEATVQKKTSPSNSKLLIAITISVLLTTIITGLVVYIWQKSANEKIISSLKQKISSLEEQLPATNKTKVTPQPSPSTELSPTPTSEPSATPKTYSNEKYGFSFDYPQSWVIEQKDGDKASFSNVADDHTISVMVWRVTGFGYCYKYGERKEIVVGGKTAETADGVGGTEMCDQPEEYANLGSTFVLIPLKDKPEGLPTNQIHISYDYPIGDKDLAKFNLEQILSTFKFAD